MRGQASTEYLVVVAVIIIIALAIIGIMGGFIEIGTETSDKTVRVYYKRTPIGILDWGFTNGDDTFVVRNNQEDAITITAVNIDGNPLQTLPVRLKPGEGKALAGEVNAGGIPEITYTTSRGLTKTFTGKKPILWIADGVSVTTTSTTTTSTSTTTTSTTTTSITGNPVTGCTDITSSGTYVLQNDIMDSSQSQCINIQANDVVFDCQSKTIDGDRSAEQGIYVYRGTPMETNILIRMCTITDWGMGGIKIQNADGNTIEDTTLSGNSGYAISLYNSNSNRIIRNSINNNDAMAIYLLGANNLIDESVIEDNSNWGIHIEGGSPNTTVINSVISDGNPAGIYCFNCQNDKFFNNFLNNTDNIRLISTAGNTYNTTKQTGISIVGGSFIGGNFWAKPDGTGFSETCTQSTDGICDAPYQLDASNIDYLPLTKP